MTRLLAVVLFVCSTAATQATENLVLNTLITGSLITAKKHNDNNDKIVVKVNKNLADVGANTLKVDANGAKIGTLTNQVNSFIPLPTGCTAGQTIVYNGSAWECHDQM
jgi:hypothetical protein